MQQLVSRFPIAESGKVLRVSNIAATFAIGAAFCMLALGCIAITRYDGPIATIWIPNAVVAAFLLHSSQDRPNPLLWIGIFAGSAGANFLAEFPLHHTFLFALANVVEIAIAVHLSRHWCGGRPKMDNVNHLARFILASGVIASTSSGVIAMIAMGMDAGFAFTSWLSWFLTDALGMIIIVPIILLGFDALRGRG